MGQIDFAMVYFKTVWAALLTLYESNSMKSLCECEILLILTDQFKCWNRVRMHLRRAMYTDVVFVGWRRTKDQSVFNRIFTTNVATDFYPGGVCTQGKPWLKAFAQVVKNNFGYISTSTTGDEVDHVHTINDGD